MLGRRRGPVKRDYVRKKANVCLPRFCQSADMLCKPSVLGASRLMSALGLEPRTRRLKGGGVNPPTPPKDLPAKGFALAACGRCWGL